MAAYIAGAIQRWMRMGYRSSFDVQSLDRQIHCLDIMPERQQECAAGSSGGAVSLWDLRFSGQPVLCSANADHGDVVEVRPD